MPSEKGWPGDLGETTGWATYMGLKDGQGKGKVEDILDGKNRKCRHWAGLQIADLGQTGDILLYKGTRTFFSCFNLFF